MLLKIISLMHQNNSVSDGKPPIPVYKKSNKQKGKVEENSDKYREPNTNNLKHLFTKVFSKDSLKWEVGLRSYHPDYQDCFTFTNSKFHISNIKKRKGEAKGDLTLNKMNN